jgi:hypothetical protein
LELSADHQNVPANPEMLDMDEAIGELGVDAHSLQPVLVLPD